jgi:hypothetical protein
MFSLTDSSTYAHESLRLLTARDHIFLPHLAFHVYDITYTDISEHPETNLHLLETRNPLLFAGLLVSLVAQTSWDLCQLACSARPPARGIDQHSRPRANSERVSSLFATAAAVLCVLPLTARQVCKAAFCTSAALQYTTVGKKRGPCVPWRNTRLRHQPPKTPRIIILHDAAAVHTQWNFHNAVKLKLHPTTANGLPCGANARLSPCPLSSCVTLQTLRNCMAFQHSCGAVARRVAEEI